MYRTNAVQILRIIALTSLLCVQCSTGNHRQSGLADIKPPKSNLDLQEESVYSAVLSDVYVSKGGNRLVIEDDTNSHQWSKADEVREFLAFLKNNGTWTDLDPRIVDDFLSKNSDPIKLTGRLNSKVDVVMLSEEELADISASPDFWIEFLARYPGQSIITLSRIGFSDDLKSALVVTGEQCGGRCGNGTYVFLSRQGDHWTVQRKFGAWSS